MYPNKGQKESNTDAVEQKLTINDLDCEEKATSHLYFGSIELENIINQHTDVKKNLIFEGSSKRGYV